MKPVMQHNNNTTRNLQIFLRQSVILYLISPLLQRLKEKTNVDGVLIC